MIQNKIQRVDKFNKSTQIQQYKIEEFVLLKNETNSKLDNIHLGPHEVIEDLGPNLNIKIENKQEIVHKTRIKKFISNL